MPHSRANGLRVGIVIIALLATVGCASRVRPFTAPPQSVSEHRQFSYTHNISLFRVSNGMMVASVPDRNTNLVQVDMRYRVGAAEDPKGKEGLAHLVEHIMFELRKDGEATTITDRLRQHALFHNASTTWDATNYTATGVAANLKALLAIERDRLASDCSMLSDELLVREREVVRQEIAWRHGDGRTARDILREELLGESHAYKHPVGGSDASVASIGRDDVCAFMKQYYAPDRTMLIVSGNVDPKLLPGVVGPMFGPIETKATKPRTPIATPVFHGLESTLKLDIEEPAVIIAFPYPAWGTDELVHADLLTDILNAELESAAGSKHLEDVQMGVVGGLRSRVIFWILTADDVEHRPAMVELFFKIRAGLIANNPSGRYQSSKGETDVQFAHRRSLKRAALVRVLESFSSRASSVADYLQYTDHLLFMLKDMANLTNALLPDLKAYASNHFQRKNSRIVLVDPLSTKDNESSQSTEDSLQAPVQEFDISTWKSPVAPGEADAPLVLDIERIHPKTQRYTLDNGMRIILAPNFEYPTIDMRMVFPVGDSMDPADRPGLAYWTAALLSSKMNNKWPASIWNRVIDVRRMGGALEAWTTGRSTVFRNRGLAMYADGLLWQLHWLLESGTTASQLRKSKKLVRKEREADLKARKEAEDKPFARYRKTLLAGIFGAKHPYAFDRSLDEVFLSLDPEELEKFRDLNYGANGATLIVSGHFDPIVVGKDIEALFNNWPARGNAAPVTRIPDADDRSKALHAIIVDDDLPHPQITIAFPSTRGLLKDRALRLVTKEMISQRVSSVRERLGASYGVSVSANFNAGPGSVLIRGTVNRQKGAAALKLMTEELTRLRSGHELGDDFARARRKVLQQTLADAVNATRVAAQLVSEVTYNLPPDHSDRLANDIGQLTIAQAREQLAKDLRAEHTVLIIRGPKALGEALFKSIGVSDYVVN